MRLRILLCAQKMPIIALILALLSCNENGRSDESLLNSLDEGNIHSTLLIIKENEEIYHSLNNKLMDPVTAERAKIWDSIARKIDVYSEGIQNYIDALYKGMVTRKSMKREMAGELYKTLIGHRAQVLRIHPAFAEAFGKRLTLISKKFDSTGNENDFYNEHFRDNSTQGSRAILSMLRNNIKIIENKLITFCDLQVGSFIDYYTTYSTIVGQNSAVLGAREYLEIMAGVGEFSKSSKPEIMINGQLVPLNENGISVYKFRVSRKPGKYAVPVQIEFFDEFGKRQTVERNVEYTVVIKD